MDPPAQGHSIYTPAVSKGHMEREEGPRRQISILERWDLLFEAAYFDDLVEDY